MSCIQYSDDRKSLTYAVTTVSEETSGNIASDAGHDHRLDLFYSDRRAGADDTGSAKIQFQYSRRIAIQRAGVFQFAISYSGDSANPDSSRENNIGIALFYQVQKLVVIAIVLIDIRHE